MVNKHVLTGKGHSKGIIDIQNDSKINLACPFGCFNVTQCKCTFLKFEKVVPF